MVSTSYIIKGGVTLVGFGPGNPDLLTVAAVKALSAADVIYYDDLIGKDYLDGLSARKVYVGKRCGAHHAEQNQINGLLLQSALAGQAVVRLKGVTLWCWLMPVRKLRFWRSMGCRCMLFQALPQPLHWRPVPKCRLPIVIWRHRWRCSTVTASVRSPHRPIRWFYYRALPSD